MRARGGDTRAGTPPRRYQRTARPTFARQKCRPDSATLAGVVGSFVAFVTGDTLVMPTPPTLYGPVVGGTPGPVTGDVETGLEPSGVALLYVPLAR